MQEQRGLLRSGRPVEKFWMPGLRQRKRLWVQQQVWATNPEVPSARNCPGAQGQVEMMLRWNEMKMELYHGYILRVKEKVVGYMVQYLLWWNIERCFHEK